MKQIKSITGKILLFVMIVFMAHDYLVIQPDPGVGTAIVKTQLSKNMGNALAQSEHQVFHTPALILSNRIPVREIGLVTLNFPFYTMQSRLFSSSPFTPPKTV